MKTVLVSMVTASAMWLATDLSFAQGNTEKAAQPAPPPAPAAPAATDAAEQLKALVAKVQEQLTTGKRTEKELEPLIKEFDVLLAQHKAEKTDAVAQILVMKAGLYLQVFDDPEKGLGFIKQVKTDFPDSQFAQKVEAVVADVEKHIAAKKIQQGLAVGAVFPDFAEKDLEGKPLSIASLKGKPVLVDFWATWCGPCVKELPNVIKAYEKYHAKGFEIVGISLDEDKEALTKFMKEKNMTWPQYFDGKGWQSKLAAQYGISSIPATYLLDAQGKIVAKDLRGDALDTELGKLLAKP